MTLAEILLRLGCTLVGWMLVYAHALMLAVISRLDCTAQGPRFGRDALLFAGLAALFLPLIPMGRKLPGLTSILRAFTVPLALAVPLAVREVWPFAVGSTLGDASLCAVLEPTAAGSPAAPWHAWWAPLQLAVLAGAVVAAVSFWRPVALGSGAGRSGSP